MAPWGPKVALSLEKPALTTQRKHAPHLPLAWPPGALPSLASLRPTRGPAAQGLSGRAWTG